MAVVKCGASCHKIRSRPSLKAAVVGMLALGNTVTIQEYVSSTNRANIFLKSRINTRLAKLMNNYHTDKKISHPFFSLEIGTARGCA